MTTFSRLLTASEIEPLEKMVHSVELLSLQQFDTEHSFLKKIRFVDVHMELNIIKLFGNRFQTVECNKFNQYKYFDYCSV